MININELAQAQLIGFASLIIVALILIYYEMQRLREIKLT